MTTAPIFIVLETPTEPTTFFTDLDSATAAASAKATETPGTEFLVFESRKADVVPVPDPVITDIEPQV